MYQAICTFKDLQDKHLYNSGDVFPFDGRAIPANRINELISGKNKANKPLIRLVEEAPATEPKRRKKAVKTPETAE